MTEWTAAEKSALLGLARAAIRDRLFADGSLDVARRAIQPTSSLQAPLACFVTLMMRGDTAPSGLRGCIGSTEARLPAPEAVVAAAIAAAFSDPRFSPVTRDELPLLVVSISTLSPFVAVTDPDRLVVGLDGVVLHGDGHTAIFLPEVGAEQGWSRTQLLEQLSRKAGLSPDGWRGAHLSSFRSVRFAEEPGEADRIAES